MAFGASDHQKEKCSSAPVYSTDSLCHDHMCSVSSVLSRQEKLQELRSISLSPKQQLQSIELQAKQMFTNMAPPQQVRRFLQNIPWHVLQAGSAARPVLPCSAPGSERQPGYVVFGAFMHGGIVGITKVTKQMPYLTRMVLSEVRHQCHDFVGTSVCVSCNVQSSPHRDVFNLRGLQNVVIPVLRPTLGGEVWTEDAECQGSSQVMSCGKEGVKGRINPLSSPVKLCPQKWHATMPWQGDRIVAIGYSIGGYAKLKPQDRHYLRMHSFPLPGPQHATQHVSMAQTLRLRSSQALCDSPPPSVNHSSLQDAGRECDEEGDAGQTPVDGRNSTQQLDQGPTVGASVRAECRESGARRDHHDRARSGEDNQPLQTEGRIAAAPEGAFTLLPAQSYHGPAQEQDLQAPDGDSGDTFQQRVHGIREVRSHEVRGGADPGAQLHSVVRHNSHRESRELLADEAICSMGSGGGNHGEGADDPTSDRNVPTRIPSSVIDSSTAAPIPERDHGQVLGGDSRPRDDPRGGHGAHQSPRGRASSPAAGSGQSRRVAAQGPGHQFQASVAHREVGFTEPLEDDGTEETSEESLGDHTCEKLPFQTARRIGRSYEEALMHQVRDFGEHKVKVIEIGGCERSPLALECERIFGKGSALQLSFWNGGDLNTEQGRGYIGKVLEEERPKLVWFSPDFTPFFPVSKDEPQRP